MSRVCTEFKRNGSCRLGDACKYIHQAENIRRIAELKAHVFEHLPIHGLVNMVTGLERPAIIQVYVNREAFAAHMLDGRLLVWGRYNGTVENVNKVFENSDNSCFTALLRDGASVVIGSATAVDRIQDGHSSARAVRVCHMYEEKFAALLENGQVIVRGIDGYVVPVITERVKRLFTARNWVTGVKHDNKTLITWSVDTKITYRYVMPFRVSTIVSTAEACAALLENGDVVAWGNAEYGGVIDRVIGSLLRENVVRLTATSYAFAAILRDGTVVTWGDGRGGGDSKSVRQELVDVTEILANEGAFLARTQSGGAVVWGARGFGGDSNFARGIIQNRKVKMVCPVQTGFEILLLDDTLVSAVAPPFYMEEGTRNRKLTIDDIKGVEHVARVFGTVAYMDSLVEMKSGAIILNGEFGPTVHPSGHSVHMLSNTFGFVSWEADGNIRGFGTPLSSSTANCGVPVELLADPATVYPNIFSDTVVVKPFLLPARPLF